MSSRMQSKTERIKDFLTNAGVNSQTSNLSVNSTYSSESRVQNLLSIFRLNWQFIISTTVVAVIALICYYPFAFLFLLFLIYSVFLILIAITGTMYFQQLYRCKPYPDPRLKRNNFIASAIQNPIFDVKSSNTSPSTSSSIKSPGNLPMIFSKTIDLQLQQILEHILEDFMMSWLKNVTSKPAHLNDILRKDIWNAVQRIHERSKKLDAAKIIAVDMVNRVTIHLEKIRIAELRANENLSSNLVFSTHSYLVDEEKELQFLSKLCETIIILLLPRGYSLPPLKNLLCEILSYKILYPLIKMITSPDYINQKIVQNFESSLKAAAISRRSYEYADNYTDILNIINNCDNLEELTLLRQSVVNDLLHATTMQQNIQRSNKGQHHHHHPHHHHSNVGGSNNMGGNNVVVGSNNNNGQYHGIMNFTKSEQITASKLKQYIEQLTNAKEQCERNLQRHGWSLNVAASNNGQLNLTLKKILNSALGRQHLMLFLGPLKATTLVEFYYAVEKLRFTSKSFVYQLASDIFYSYIKVPNSEIILDKNHHKQFECFLVGDVGVDIFYEVQRQVYQTLEEKYYQPFLLSEQCHILKMALNKEDEMNKKEAAATSAAATAATTTATTTMLVVDNNKDNIETCTISTSTTGLEEIPPSTSSTGMVVGPSTSSSPSSSSDIKDIAPTTINAKEVGSYSLYIRKKLDEIQDRIDKKQQALEALRHSMKADSKILIKLERDIDYLEMAKCQAETQLKRTDIWMENLGKWKANVQNVEVSDENESIQFIILVYVDEEQEQEKEEKEKEKKKEEKETRRSGEEELHHVPGSASNGWVVMKTLKELQEIHSKLKQLRPQLKVVDFPTNFKLFFIRNERNSLEKIKKQTQKFLNMILEDDLLNGCEAIYIFLGPFSSDYLSSLYGGGGPVTTKRSKFSLSTLFRGDKIVDSSGTTSSSLTMEKNNDRRHDNSSMGVDGGGNHPLDFNSINSVDVVANSTLINDYDEDHSTGSGVDHHHHHKLITVDGEGKDSIAEPLYALMGEIFDMGGVFKWLRKSLISFVQITYGRTINRQIRESTSYLFEETMLHYYFSSILKSFWPGGVLITSFQTRSEENKECTATAAKELLMANIPEILCNLVGTQAAKRGILKVFNVFQNPIYNKQLFYELLEIVMVELFPEIKQLHVRSPLRSATGTGATTTTTTTTTTTGCGVSGVANSSATTTTTTGGGSSSSAATNTSSSNTTTAASTTSTKTHHHHHHHHHHHPFRKDPHRDVD